MTFKQIATTTLFSALLLSAPAAMAQDPQGYGQPPQSAAAAQPADDATVTVLVGLPKQLPLELDAPWVQWLQCPVWRCI